MYSFYFSENRQRLNREYFQTKGMYRTAVLVKKKYGNSQNPDQQKKYQQVKYMR